MRAARRGGDDRRVEIWIRVQETRPPQGTLAANGGPARPFAGWLGLLAALEAVISPRSTPPPGPPGPCPPPGSGG